MTPLMWEFTSKFDTNPMLAGLSKLASMKLESFNYQIKMKKKSTVARIVLRGSNNLPQGPFQVLRVKNLSQYLKRNS